MAQSGCLSRPPGLIFLLQTRPRTKIHNHNQLIRISEEDVYVTLHQLHLPSLAVGLEAKLLSLKSSTLVQVT